MNSDEDTARYYAVMDWYDLERRKKGADLVPLIKARLADGNTNAEKIALLQALSWELRDQDKFTESADALLEWAALEPGEPMALISLAGQRLYIEGNAEQALVDIDRAIALAEASGNFRRHALNTKARILVKLKDNEALEKCLISIVETKVLPGQRDIGRERDFFDRIPPGAISYGTRNLFLEYLA